MNLDDKFKNYQELVEVNLNEILKVKEPRQLYEPIEYFISNGGKRIRPVLTMIAAGTVGGNPLDALLTGCAIEIMHNFTLAHDDIMDKSEFRRGKPTIHKKWDESIAILAGDVMLGIAYNIIPQHKNYNNIIKALNIGLIEVCEGQILDMNFNKKNDVKLDEYLTMITKKTAALLETCVVAGAYCGNANQQQIHSLIKYARNVGLAFQIQDDMLDMIADEAQLGKKIGLDIQEGKKTFLIIKANELASKPEHKELLDKFSNNNSMPADYVLQFRNMFEELGIFDLARIEISKNFELASTALTELNDNEHKEMLHHLITMLYKRYY